VLGRRCILVKVERGTVAVLLIDLLAAMGVMTFGLLYARVDPAYLALLSAITFALFLLVWVMLRRIENLGSTGHLDRIAKTDFEMKIRWLRFSLVMPASVYGVEMIEGNDSSFGDGVRHRLVEEFVVSYLNGSLKPNLAEKNPMNGRDVEFLMDGPQLDRTKKTDVWSYSNAVGTGYQYRVVYKDRRFSDLDRLLQLYSGTLSASEEDRPAVEQRLYEQVVLMLKEGRLPKTFKIQSAAEAENQKLASMVEELGHSLEELGKRVRKLEDQLTAREEIETRDEQQTLA
jgi:hypothetical protein